VLVAVLDITRPDRFYLKFVGKDDGQPANQSKNSFKEKTCQVFAPK
jgi:hypothetical protein